MASKPEKKASETGTDGERIAKVMARAGLCSRRDAEAWIAAGRVSLNGKKLQSPAVNVRPQDDVRVDGKPLPAAEKTRLFRYHKPRGLVTTAKDPEGRATVFDSLPDSMPRVISVGRLDITSEGLLLLTNDGELARRLELPATGWVRRYRVRVNGRIDPTTLLRLAKGIEVDGVKYGAIEAALDRQQGDNAWLTMSLTEGKNREIRKVCAFFGWTVSRLIRLSYGPFQLGHLEKGEIEEVPSKVLRDQLGAPGAVEPLRPQQPEGGKARPPKPVVEAPRKYRPRQAERQAMREKAGGWKKSDDRPPKDKSTNWQSGKRKSAEAFSGDRQHADNKPMRDKPVRNKSTLAKSASGQSKATNAKPGKPRPDRPRQDKPASAGNRPVSGKKHAHRQRRP